MKGSQPLVPCMEQLLSPALTKVANDLFGYSILKMSIDTTEGKSLICTCTRVLEVIIDGLFSWTVLFSDLLRGSTWTITLQLCKQKNALFYITVATAT
jgi:hypothetical protein